MQDGFDPYYKWLGIPPQDQPPHHYRLLAIPLFESDPEVIESAADQRMGHVRRFQSGKHSVLSQRILNELAAARVCLLSPEKKAAYDAELKARLTPGPPLPPQASTGSSILPAPPPPIETPPGEPRELGPSAQDVAPPPAGSALNQPSSPFPPLEPPLPNPVLPSPVGSSSRMTRRPRDFWLVATSAGVILLLSAGAVFWGLYTGQRDQDSFSTATVGAPQNPSTGEPAAPARDLPQQEDAPNEAAAVAEEPAEMPSAMVPEPTEKEEPEETEEQRPGSPATTVEDRNPQASEPAVDAADDTMAAEGESEAPIEPSLADVLQEAMPAIEPPEEEVQEADNESREEKAAEKEPVPRPSVLKRREKDLWVYRQADYATLIAEAEKPDRPPPETYVLLKFAYQKAIQAHDATDVLNVLDLIEERFLGDYDRDRVRALTVIGLHWSRQRDARRCRDLASVAFQAGQDALAADNKPLAEGLGRVALKAAGAAGHSVLEEDIEEFLRGL